jgi:hypothetical protein
MAISTGAAILGAAVIGGGASLLGASKASKAAGNATEAQLLAAREANELQKYMYDTTRTDQAPWREAGAAALGQLQEFLKPGADLGALLAKQPGYQARLAEGVNALDRSASARGGIGSGGALKALTRFGQDYASNELNNVFNRYAALAGIGQTANQAIGQAGQNYANQAGSNLIGAGQARASGYYGQAAAQNYGLQGIANAGQNLLGYFSQGGMPRTTPVDPPMTVGSSLTMPVGWERAHNPEWVNTPANIPRF